MNYVFDLETALLDGHQHPIMPVWDIIVALQKAKERVEIWTGRLDEFVGYSTRQRIGVFLDVRKPTERYFDEGRAVVVRMRSLQDSSESVRETTERWLQECFDQHREPGLVFENDETKADMYRKYGIPVCSVLNPILIH